LILILTISYVIVLQVFFNVGEDAAERVRYGYSIDQADEIDEVTAISFLNVKAQCVDLAKVDEAVKSLSSHQLESQDQPNKSDKAKQGSSPWVPATIRAVYLGQANNMLVLYARDYTGQPGLLRVSAAEFAITGRRPFDNYCY
jgi:hypothetical protein